MTYASDVAFTAAVKQAQRDHGSRSAYARMETQRGGFMVAITDDLASFIAQRDSAYLATASAGGQPYVQHRGGRPGFIRVLDEHTLAFADFVGNKQYITAGNLASNDRVALFLMDYPHQARLKIIGHARIVDLGEDPALEAKLRHPADPAKVERIFLISVVAYDWNCSQYITPRFTKEEYERGI